MNDLISRQAVLSEIETVCFSKVWSKFRADNGSNGTRDYIINYIEQLPSVTPEPCGMTAEEYRQRMIQAFQNSDCDELIALVCLPDEKEFENLEWLLKTHYKKEPCKSCISKESVLHIFDDMTKEFVKTGDFDRASGIAWVAVQKLPSIQPEQRTGKWVKDKERSITFDVFKCSLCGGGGLRFNFCPDCGAKMEEGE